MEHLNISSLRSQQAALGQQLARSELTIHTVNQILAWCHRLHLHNIDGERRRRGRERSVEQFGFSCETCCGLLPMPNEWKDDWVVSVCVRVCVC